MLWGKASSDLKCFNFLITFLNILKEKRKFFLIDILAISHFSSVWTYKRNVPESSFHLQVCLSSVCGTNLNSNMEKRTQILLAALVASILTCFGRSKWHLLILVVLFWRHTFFPPQKFSLICTFETIACLNPPFHSWI